MAIHSRRVPVSVDAQPPKGEEHSSVLDYAKLALLEELIGSAKCASALRKFKAELAIRIAAIESTSTGPADKARHAHKLVGVAGIFGLAELCDESRRLMAAVHENADDLQPYVGSLLRAAA